MRACRLGVALFAGLVAAAAEASGASTCSENSSDCATVGKWDLSVALGYGARTNPIAGNADVPLIVIPKISYYGKRFFLDNLEFGFTLYENDESGFNLIATPGYDRVFFFRNDPQNFFINGGVAGSNTSVSPPPQSPPPEAPKEVPRHNREVTYLLGPEWQFEFHSLTGQLDALYEVTGRYGGAEVRAALSVPLLRSHGTLTAAVGGTWKSSSLVTYYYGEPGVYEGGAAFNPFVKLSYSRSFNARWGLQAFAHYERLGDAIASSPIVAERNVTTFFAGVTYSLKR